MRLENWLYKRACISGQRPALFYQGSCWTFEELYREAHAYGQRLRSLLNHDEHRVAVLSNNSAHMYIAILGLQQISCEMVLLNTRLTVHELFYQISDSGVTTLLVEKELLEVAARLSQLSEQLVVHALEDFCLGSMAEHTYKGAEASTAFDKSDQEPLQAAENSCASNKLPLIPMPYASEFDFDQVTSILYTSGTTGNPKGVMQSFGNHWWSATASMLNLGLEPIQDSWICITPLFHISGLSIAMRSLVYGMPVYLHRKFDAYLINEALCAGEGTIISVVTYHLRELIATLNERHYHPTFRCMLLGGGFVEESLLAQCVKHDIDVIQSFGMTETCSQVIALSFEDAQRKIGSAGLPLMPNALRIVEMDDKIAQHPAGYQTFVQDLQEQQAISTEVPPRLVAPNQPGEIQIKSPALCVGYLNQEEKYYSSFTRDGWFKTGDVGVVDEEGYLYIKSRLTEMIISGGENVYPSEVEHYLLTFDGIAEAAVVGHKDSVWDMVPWAYLVADDKFKSHPTDETISKYLRGFLAGYKVPKCYIWVDSLPKTATGKIEKYKLVNSLETISNR